MNHQQLLKHTEYSQIGMWEYTFRGLLRLSFNYLLQFISHTMYVVVAPHKRILKEPGIDTYTGIYENDSVRVHVNAAL